MIVVILSLNIAFLLNSASGDILGERGTFGDMFGASNALFSGLAFAGIIWTMIQQRKELKLQREELRLTREEMELTRAEFSEQNQTSALQRFENTFFNLIDLILENRDRIRVQFRTSHVRRGSSVIQTGGGTENGKGALNRIGTEIVNSLRTEYSKSRYGNAEKVLKGKERAEYKTFSANHRKFIMRSHIPDYTWNEITCWVDSVLSALDWVENNCQLGQATEAKVALQVQYSSILFLNLSPNELVILMYVSWSGKGFKRSLIEKYKPFQKLPNLPDGELESFNQWLANETSDPEER